MVIMAITYLAVTPLALMGTTMLLMFTTMPPLVITLHVRDHRPATPGHPPAIILAALITKTRGPVRSTLGTGPSPPINAYL